MANSQPIVRGSKLLYKGFDRTPSVLIKSVQLPGHPGYDGGLPGISFKYLKGDRKSWFYPCNSLEEFFSDIRFANLQLADFTIGTSSTTTETK